MPSATILMSRGASSPSLRKGGADVQGGGGGKLPSATILTDWTHRLSQRPRAPTENYQYRERGGGPQGGEVQVSPEFILRRPPAW